MRNIAIIGAGQLGSRHLQALANCKNVIDIQVVDSSNESLKVAEQRFNEVSQNFKGQIFFHNNISYLKKNIDVAIIATNSKVRRNVVEELVKKSKVKNLVLEKFLFTNEEDFVFIDKLLKENEINAWVNCPRRMMSFYQSLQQEINGPIHFTATGNMWGLGCNGIHLLDLFAFLTKSTHIILSNNQIDQTLIESKRSGYIEFTGTITGHSGDNSFHITSFSNDSSPLHISIYTPKVRYRIEEGAITKIYTSRLLNNWIEEVEDCKMPFQSQLTNIFIDELIENGSCKLTPYSESKTLHLIFLNNLLNFLRKVKYDNTINECPIT